MSRLLESFVARTGDERALIVEDGGRRRSRAEIVRRAAEIAATLRARNAGTVLAGKRVAILVPPGGDFVAAFFGVLLAGGCVIVLSPLHPMPETRYFCADGGVRTVLTSASMLELARPLADTHDVIDLTALTGPAALHDLEADAAAEEAHALQLYTSGTTGKPKGAVLTHENIGVQQKLVGEAWGFSENDVLLHALPLHHMHGLAIALLTAIGARASVRMRSFDAPSVWDEMKDATVFMGVPAMYHRLFLAFDAATEEQRSTWREHARALRLATSGSAALPVTLGERWRGLTGTIPLERFGMTEIGVGITNSLTGPRFPGCVGLPLPTVETKIVGDEEGAETGELWIRGPSVFVGYHGRREETEAAFVADASGGARWFRTGDTVTREASLAGAPFRILGRTSVDILKSGGYKLSALEIEEVLREHAAVAEVAVVGLPDEAWGERVVACVIKKVGASCDVQDLRAFARGRLAIYKVPKDVIFLDELPKNALGKVVKPDLLKKLGAVK